MNPRCYNLGIGRRVGHAIYRIKGHMYRMCGRARASFALSVVFASIGRVVDRRNLPRP